MSGHTPGPWRVRGLGNDGARIVETERGHHVTDFVMSDANAHLIAAAPDLLAEVEDTYAFLADIANQWPGRHSAEGQARLCRLRDLICKVTSREPQDVQDDYGNRRLRDRVATSIRATHGHKGGS
jgi:hypothetical protein